MFWTATFTSRLISRKTEILALPSVQVVWTSWTPSTPRTASSTGSATSDSMIWGEALGREMETLTTGKLMSGIWDTPIRKKQMMPKKISPNMSIQAKTGFLIETSDNVISTPFSPRRH